MEKIFSVIVNIFIDRLGGFLARIFRHKKLEAQAKEKAAQDMQPLKEAKTGEQKDAAADSALDNL